MFLCSVVLLALATVLPIGVIAGYRLVAMSHESTKMSNLYTLQKWLRENALSGILVPSTDEFLSEWSPPHARRLTWATGYTGSMGTAVVLQNDVSLFADGRYNKQGESETRGLDVEVILSPAEYLYRSLTNPGLQNWINNHLQSGDRLAIDPALHSQAEVVEFADWAIAAGIELVYLETNPIDTLWHNRPPIEYSSVYEYPLAYAGKSSSNKRCYICSLLKDKKLDGYLVADPEDIAWLLNVRADDWPITPVCLSVAFLSTDNVLTWFVDENRLTKELHYNLADTVIIVSPAILKSVLYELVVGKVVGANLSRTPAKLARIIAIAAEAANQSNRLIDDNTLEYQRWQKNPGEIEAARNAHYIDGIAIIRFMAWLAKTIQEQTVTELDAANRITAFRKEHKEFKAISMPTLSASGANAALPHYIPNEKTNRILNEHPIYWIDSGAHYFGGTTDNTLCMAVGKPDKKHIIAHTLVLKGFINLATARVPEDSYASQLDSLAREFLWRAGMDCAHGIGHGVGNFLCIHERIVINRFNHIPIKQGMIFSNEPGYYQEGEFGVRIESHMAVVASAYPGFIEFETLSRLPIDPKLITPELLTEEEKRWLNDYHRCIWKGYQNELDVETKKWLKELVDFYSHLTNTK